MTDDRRRVPDGRRRRVIGRADARPVPDRSLLPVLRRAGHETGERSLGTAHRQRPRSSRRSRRRRARTMPIILKRPDDVS